MGQEKAFAILGGQTLLAHVIARIASQTDEVFINANGDPARFDGFGRAVIPDLSSGIASPLAGLQAACSLQRRDISMRCSRCPPMRPSSRVIWYGDLPKAARAQPSRGPAVRTIS